MNHPKMISMLRCPIDGSQLECASKDVLRRLNQAIQHGELRDQNDQKVTGELQAGLVAGEGRRFYPIREGIASLVAGEAINLPQAEVSAPLEPNAPDEQT